jgi:hypothetical protein
VTVDEELNVLEESIRRLKIEYDVFFGGGSKRPPSDTEWRVSSLIRKYSDSNKLSYAQRFRYNGIAQRYAIFSDLWRQKLKIKEEGYRRPQDANLGISGLRTEQEHAAAVALEAQTVNPNQPFRVVCSDADVDYQNVHELFEAMVRARTRAGDAAAANASFESFKNFVKKKTEQIRKEFGCRAVEYSIEVENNQVRLKAKAKI